MCSALPLPRGFKNDIYLIVARLFRPMAKRTTYISRVAFVSPHGLNDDECYMCSALVSPHGLKNYEYYMCSSLVSPHGFKNDVHFMCNAHVSAHCLNDEGYLCGVCL